MTNMTNMTCAAMQMAMSEHLKPLETYHISTIPKVRLTLERLEPAADPEAAEILFQELRQALGESVTLTLTSAAFVTWILQKPCVFSCKSLSVSLTCPIAPESEPQSAFAAVLPQ